MFHTIYAYGYWNNDNRWNTTETSNETAIFHAPFLMCFIVLRIELSRLLFSLLKGLKPTVNFSRIFFLFWLYTYIQFLWVIQCQSRLALCYIWMFQLGLLFCAVVVICIIYSCLWLQYWFRLEWSYCWKSC